MKTPDPQIRDHKPTRHESRRALRRFLVALMLGTSCLGAQAERADQDKPVNIEADRVEIDDDAPAWPAPTLQVNAVTANTAHLTWNPATDPAGIRSYEVELNGNRSFLAYGSAQDCLHRYDKRSRLSRERDNRRRRSFHDPGPSGLGTTRAGGRQPVGRHARRLQLRFPFAPGSRLQDRTLH